MRLFTVAAAGLQLRAGEERGGPGGGPALLLLCDGLHHGGRGRLQLGGGGDAPAASQASDLLPGPPLSLPHQHTRHSQLPGSGQPGALHSLDSQVSQVRTSWCNLYLSLSVIQTSSSHTSYWRRETFVLRTPRSSTAATSPAPSSTSTGRTR